MIRVARVHRDVDARFPSVFAPPPAQVDEAPAVANVLESFFLNDGDDLRAVIGVESWVTKTAWVSYGGLALGGSPADATGAQDFALRELGMQTLLGFTSTDAERKRVENELRGYVIGEIRSVGRPTTIFRIGTR